MALAGSPALLNRAGRRFSYYAPYSVLGLFLYQLVATPLTHTFYLFSNTDAASAITFAINYEFFVSVAADFGRPGPFAVGLQKVTIPDVTGKHPMPTMFWYPATGPATDPTAKIIKATRDAPPATTGPYPLVLLLHGLSGLGVVYSTLGRQLASYGFVVAAADYDHGLVGPTDGGVSRNEQTAVWLLYDHPRNVVRVIGYADTLTAAGGSLAGIIDTSHIGVWGHSTGGSTVFQAGGAQVDLKEMDAWCATRIKEVTAAETCQFVGQEQPVAAHYGVADPFAAPMPAIWDSRVAALVGAAPGGELHAFGDTGIAAVNLPTLIMYAADDSIVFPKYNALWAYEGIGSQDKALVEFSGGGHVMFGEQSDRRFAEQEALTTAFFLAFLKGDPAGRALLVPDGMPFPDVHFRTTIH